MCKARIPYPIVSWFSIAAAAVKRFAVTIAIIYVLHCNRHNPKRGRTTLPYTQMYSAGAAWVWRHHLPLLVYMPLFLVSAAVLRWLCHDHCSMQVCHACRVCTNFSGDQRAAREFIFSLILKCRCRGNPETRQHSSRNRLCCGCPCWTYRRPPSQQPVSTRMQPLTAQGN